MSDSLSKTLFADTVGPIPTAVPTSFSPDSTEPENTSEPDADMDLLIDDGPPIVAVSAEPASQSNPEPETAQEEAQTEYLSTGNAMAGRVTVLQPDGYETAQSLTIIEQPDFGHASVNSDGTISLVLTDAAQTGSVSLSYQIIQADGAIDVVSETLDVANGTQAAGWAQGNHYMLATDEDDRVIIETGENHRKVFVSNSEDALTLADIAAREGIDFGDVTDLLNDPGRAIVVGRKIEELLEDYGASEDMALAPDAGMALWYATTWAKPANSNWLLFESGYEYDDLGQVVSRETFGEDPLHPVHITSWGEGEKPVILSEVKIWQKQSENIVFTDLTLKGGFAGLTGRNILLEDIDFTGKGAGIQHAEGVTIRHSDFYDIFYEEIREGFDDWAPHSHRTGGLYVGNVDGVLLEDIVVSQTGWEEGYAEDGNPAYNQPPSQYSHNIYIQRDVTDFTIRDSISAKAASFGLQAKSGGFLDGNLIFENNAGFAAMGGNTDGYSDSIGNYSLVLDNIVTSGAHKGAHQIGALANGFYSAGIDSSLVGNVLTHLADPNDPSDLEGKEFNSGTGVYVSDPFYDDTIIYNWHGDRDERNNWSEGLNQNVDGLDRALADQTTIQNLAKLVLNDPDADQHDLAEFVKHNDVSVEELIAYFQQGFGVSDGSIRTTNLTLTFEPDERGDGVRWDNRLNWSTEDDVLNGDSIDLAGNWVNYSGTFRINNLTLGEDGTLAVAQGKLTIEGTLTGGTDSAIDVSYAGQLWLAGDLSGALHFDVSGGRFVNTVNTSSADPLTINISGGQAILATAGATFNLSGGDILTIEGSAANLGFDGETGGLAMLTFDTDAELRFDADSGGFSTIREFRSGAFGDSPNVASRVDFGDSTLVIDLSDAAGLAGTFNLITVDQLVGEFQDIEVQGLPSNQDAALRIDYVNDTVTITLTNGGSGSVSSQTITAEGENDGTTINGDNPEGGETPGDAPAIENVMVNGSDGSDYLAGGLGDDTLGGGDGSDTLVVGDGNDFAFGNAGADTIYGAGGDDFVAGGKGADTVYGGSGDDQVKGGRGLDDLYGGRHDDTLYGGGGSDTLDGGAGNDVLVGGGGVDILTGGLGADTFTVASARHSTLVPNKRDHILDFSQDEGDLISLSGFDANTLTAGINSFSFIGEGETAGAGTLSFTHSNGTTSVLADIDGGGADVSILIQGEINLTESDFVL
ncbi:MAG: calcium-binding protein [Paracoccaceae bacterium]